MSLAKDFIEASKTAVPPSAKPGEPVIEIHGPIQRLTALYERFRTLLDYQEERFIRRLSIRRILFRRALIEGEAHAIGEPLVRELIRAGYLENGRYPQSFAKKIDALLEKYLQAIPVLEQSFPGREAVRMQRRLLGIAAAEIEEYLNPSTVENLLVERLSAEISTYTHTKVDDHIRMIALRSYLKADAELIAWRLLQTSARKDWQDFTEKPDACAADIAREIARIEFAVEQRDLETQVRRFRRLVPPYLILTELAYREPEKLNEIIENPDRFEGALAELVNQRNAQTELRIQKSMVRATIYIFITKILFGIATEVPYDLAMHGKIAYVPLGINLLFPPLLMVIAALGIRPPSQENTRILVQRAITIIADENLPSLPEVEESQRLRSSVMGAIFSLFYLATYLLSFGGLIWLLLILDFTLASVLIFLFFLSVVGFFAFRIRTSARELAIIRDREGILFLVFDFFALPFLRVGRWLSGTIRQVNVMLFVLDYLIEAPLKIAFVAAEDWFAFLREKREELS